MEPAHRNADVRVPACAIRLITQSKISEPAYLGLGTCHRSSLYSSCFRPRISNEVLSLFLGRGDRIQNLHPTAAAITIRGLAVAAVGFKHSVRHLA